MAGDFSLADIDKLLQEQRRKLAPASTAQDVQRINRKLREVASDVGLQQALTQILQVSSDANTTTLTAINAVTTALNKFAGFGLFGGRFPFNNQSTTDLVVSGTTTLSSYVNRYRSIIVQNGGRLVIGVSPCFIFCDTFTVVAGGIVDGDGMGAAGGTAVVAASGNPGAKGDLGADTTTSPPQFWRGIATGGAGGGAGGSGAGGGGGHNSTANGGDGLGDGWGAGAGTTRDGGAGGRATGIHPGPSGGVGGRAGAGISSVAMPPSSGMPGENGAAAGATPTAGVTRHRLSILETIIAYATTLNSGGGGGAGGSAYQTVTGGVGGGAGGGAGGTSAGGNSGKGGDGAAAGANYFLFCNTFTNGGTVRSRGATGLNGMAGGTSSAGGGGTGGDAGGGGGGGAVGGGGGGGGGAGGFVGIVTGANQATGTIQVTGGGGGIGGTAGTPGVGGHGSDYPSPNFFSGSDGRTATAGANGSAGGDGAYMIEVVST